MCASWLNLIWFEEKLIQISIDLKIKIKSLHSKVISISRLQSALNLRGKIPVFLVTVFCQSIWLQISHLFEHKREETYGLNCISIYTEKRSRTTHFTLFMNDSIVWVEKYSVIFVYSSFIQAREYVSFHSQASISVLI